MFPRSPTAFIAFSPGVTEAHNSGEEGCRRLQLPLQTSGAHNRHKGENTLPPINSLSHTARGKAHSTRNVSLEKCHFTDTHTVRLDMEHF